MGFLKNLFGANKKESLNDSDIGNFKKLTNNGDVIVWTGQTKIFNETVSLYISGNYDQLNPKEKENLLDTLKKEKAIEPEIEDALRMQYEDADKQYSSWRNHFSCISLSAMNNKISITFEEKESYYHFNVFLVDNKVAGISVDS
ncbi:hypothetical protein QWZ08_27890 [Ferruginibacter paludis]|uniref:hypothetical protein n=1 Tax=Ferruginibacter paludis TaxID=1310417 RepID=UPI0025B4FDFA|nr:hypothetical protein [Ferruginibacter paludis]MDN3659499.1 hypothetical protein [Ferruginibacter paludis]